MCLSLLGTWQGGRGESWSPEYSTVLQVLISIQVRGGGRRGGSLLDGCWLTGRKMLEGAPVFRLSVAACLLPTS